MMFVVAVAALALVAAAMWGEPDDPTQAPPTPPPAVQTAERANL